MESLLDFRRMELTLEDKNIKRLINCRLCKDADHYNQEISKYFTYGPCHLKDLCFSKSDNVNKHFTTLFKALK